MLNKDIRISNKSYKIRPNCILETNLNNLKSKFGRNSATGTALLVFKQQLLNQKRPFLRHRSQNFSSSWLAKRKGSHTSPEIPVDSAPASALDTSPIYKESLPFYSKGIGCHLFIPQAFTTSSGGDTKSSTGLPIAISRCVWTPSISTGSPWWVKATMLMMALGSGRYVGGHLSPDLKHE